MSELLKLKFEPYYMKTACKKGWSVDVVYVDKNLIGESFEVFKQDDEYSEWYSILLEDGFVKLISGNPQGEETLIYLNTKGCFVENKNLEKTKNALDILKPVIKRRYNEIVEKKRVEKEWQEQKPFEIKL